ncbi:hypothetical protein WR25_21815 isoform B [Diploscapter pachys]|uniref:Exonuclease domain-containing protein n=1 Tax=Diploscapter pachys TaxID=2018661 RepID=A0A2A2L7I5_9BILA|nr:hypothetical protein WR25_21815 isoform B [Diploscapter pachys]
MLAHRHSISCTRTPPHEEVVEKRRQIQRKRPSTLHIRRSNIPTVSVHEASITASGTSEAVSDSTPNRMEQQQRRPRSSDRKINGCSRMQHQMSLCDNYCSEQNSGQFLTEPAPLHQSRSVSPQPRGSMRRDSMLTMLNRIWKSDECNRRPSIQKMNALDVPIPSETLTRQLSLSDTNVNPATTLAIRRATLLSFTPKQKKVLRSTFAQLNSGGTFLRLMEQIFRRLEVKCPDIRSIFLTTAFVNSLSRERSSPPLVKTEHDHCKCLVAMFERIMDSLDDITEQLQLLRQYGEKHAQMGESGFSGTMIEQFGEIAVAVIGSQDAIKYNHDAVKAWRLLLAYITDEMKLIEMASKKVDFKDVSPAWKVLQMKLHEEEVSKKVAAPNSLKKSFKKKKKNKYKFVSLQQQALNSHETKKTEQEPENPETENKPEPNEDGFTKVVTKKDRKLENRKRRLEESAASTSSTSSEQIQPSKRSKIIDIPVLIKDNERGPPTSVLALDCEYVGAGNDGTIDILARVSIVNENGKIVYDKHVKPTEPIKDYRTFVSGIRPADLEKGESFAIVQKEVASILQDRIVVGHAIHNDFRVLFIFAINYITFDF